MGVPVQCQLPWRLAGGMVRPEAICFVVQLHHKIECCLWQLWLCPAKRSYTLVAPATQQRIAAVSLHAMAAKRASEAIGHWRNAWQRNAWHERQQPVLAALLRTHALSIARRRNGQLPGWLCTAPSSCVLQPGNHCAGHCFRTAMHATSSVVVGFAVQLSSNVRSVE